MKINKKLIIFYLILLFLVLIIFQQYLSNYYSRLISVMGINIILAITLALTNGFTGVFSLGHAAFMAIGAYSCTILVLTTEKKAIILKDLPSWIIHLEFPFVLSLIIGGIITMLFEIGRASCRERV